MDSPHSWKPPPPDVLKINVDGSFVQETGEGAIACVCRDSHGFLIDIFAPTVRVNSAIQVEATAIVETPKYFQGRTESALEMGNRSRRSRTRASSRWVRTEGAWGKSASKYYAKDGVEIKEEQIKAGEEKAMGMFKAIEAHLLEDPDA
ncbi:uncharacterized protein LOC130135726 [Syzygium oleosum]|uniref:uncharacterized protein LOC130135726 n=1 Tax=Syzygium oleosum TaxID=219896 RepID=UPI0024B88A18|nr:uncharacterized protein LOC130135726 [Syzygium oleosum]